MTPSAVPTGNGTLIVEAGVTGPRMGLQLKQPRGPGWPGARAEPPFPAEAGPPLLCSPLPVGTPTPARGPARRRGCGGSCRSRGHTGDRAGNGDGIPHLRPFPDHRVLRRGWTRRELGGPRGWGLGWGGHLQVARALSRQELPARGPGRGEVREAQDETEPSAPRRAPRPGRRLHPPPSPAPSQPPGSPHHPPQMSLTPYITIDCIRFSR